MDNDPLRGLSRGVAAAAEQTPTLEAMRGNGVIATTWGDLASRLTEAGLVEPTSEAVCTFLGIQPSDLSNPELVIAEPRHAHWFEGMLLKRYETEYRTEHGPAAATDLEHLLSLKQNWKVENGVTEANRLDAIITQAALQLDDAEYEAQRTGIELICIARDAYTSGYVVELEDFIATMLSVEGLAYFKLSDLTQAVGAVLDGLMNRRQLADYVQITELTIGGSELDDFFRCVRWKFDENMKRETQKRWQLIAPFIYADSILNHPVIAGGER